MSIHTFGHNRVMLVVLLVLVASACVVRRSTSTVTVQSVQATGMAFGKVVDRNKKPVSGVQLTLLLKKCRCEDCPDKKKCDCCPLQLRYTTTESGAFQFEAAPGTYTVRAQLGDAKAEREVTISGKARQQVDIELPI